MSEWRMIIGGPLDGQRIDLENPTLGLQLHCVEYEECQIRGGAFLRWRDPSLITDPDGTRWQQLELFP